jgi:hypothetical protein
MRAQPGAFAFCALMGSPGREPAGAAGRGFTEVSGGQFRKQVTIYEFGAGMAG